MKFVRILLLGLAALFVSQGAAMARSWPGQEAFLKRAVFADGRLWALADSGVLFAITPGVHLAIRQRLPGKVVDICIFHHHALAVTQIGSGPWILRYWANGAWATLGGVDAHGDGVLALDCTADRVTLLTTRRLVDVDGPTLTEVAISGSGARGRVTSFFSLGDQVYVGFNAGEWGGGLWRIDRRTGSAKVVERFPEGDGCAGPLSRTCDPVNGIVAAPWNPECVVVAIGLVHFQPHGRLIEVCSENVRRLYYKPFDDGSVSASSGLSQPHENDEPFSTVAFFGLVSTPGAIWAAGIDGLYRIDGTQHVQFKPLPKFEKIGHFQVSFELPDVVLVLTEINERMSVSGAVPMLVTR